ncbi:MAG: exodeoxyribonuclease VII small subunit [Actinomycetota bacterium]
MSEEPMEQALERLEQLVERLESGDLSLDDAIAQFEQGIAQVVALRERLDAAELRVREVLEKGGMIEEVDPSAGPGQDG